MRSSVIAIFTFSATTVAAAQSLETMNLASNLGTVLAAEEACGLSFKQAAIEAFINDKVPADDMEFPSMLTVMTDGSRIQLKSMSQSQKTAHCRQISRIAKSYGFIE